MNGKWDSHNTHSCSAAPTVWNVVIAATLLLKARDWFCVNLIQCCNSSVSVLSSANPLGMCCAVLSTQRSVFKYKVVTDSPALERKECHLKKNMNPLPTCLHFCTALYMQHWYTGCETRQFFFLESLLSKPNTNQQTSKRAFQCDYSVTCWALLFFFFFFFPWKYNSYCLL